MKLLETAIGGSGACPDGSQLPCVYTLDTLLSANFSMMYLCHSEPLRSSQRRLLWLASNIGSRPLASGLLAHCRCALHAPHENFNASLRL